MTEISKELPFELDPNSKYAIRVRSINSFAVPSEWSETLIINTQGLNQANSSRLETDQSGLYAYDGDGKLAFVYSNDTTLRENLIVNPSFAVNVSGWEELENSSISRESDVGFIADVVKASMRVIALDDTAGIGARSSISARQIAAENEIFTVSAFIKTPSTLSSNSFTIGIQFFDSSDELIRETFSPNSTSIKAEDDWVRISAVRIKAPALTASVGIIIKCVSTLNENEFYNVDAVLLEKSSLLRQYFDGSTSAGASSWNGIEHYSTSIFDMNSPYYIDRAYVTEGVFQTSKTVETAGGIIVDPDSLRAYDPSGTLKVKIDAATGDITALDGTFTGSTFRTGLTVGVGSPPGQGVIFDGSGIRGYSGVDLSRVFEVDINGNLYAQNANITGNINATSGSFSGTLSASTGAIGGWLIAPTSLYSNSGTVGMSSGATPFWAGGATPNATFVVTSSGSLRATNANITGTITATAGLIGGWTINSSTITGGNTTLNPTGDITLGTANNVARLSSSDATYRLWIGNATAASAPFSVTQAGALVATNATITGNITATSGSFTGSITAATGTIGGWTIAPASLHSNSGTVGMGSGATPFWAGGATPNASFAVTSNGALRATNANIAGRITSSEGIIGGWTISSSTLTGGNTSLSSAGDITVGTSNNVARLSSTDGTYRLWVGNATAGSAPFSVSQTGALIATNANITGAITATSGSFTGSVTAATGSIGGWQIAPSSLHSNSATTGMSSGATPFWAGGATPNASFAVSSSGHLRATSANITGNITATSGNIAGWLIGTNELYKGSGSSKIALNADATPKFYIGVGNHGSQDTAFYADNGGRFSLSNQLIFNPAAGSSGVDDFADLTVVGKIRGAVENVTLIPSNKLQVSISGVNITSSTAATITTATNAFLTNEYVIIEGLSGNAAAANGVYQISVVNQTTFTITISGGIVSNTTGIVGATATLREITLGLHPSEGSGSFSRSQGIGLRLDKYNWWMTNNQFRVGTSGTYMKWNGTRFDISGAGTKTLSMAVGSADADNYFAIANNGVTPAYNNANTQFIVNAEGKLSLGTSLTWDGSTLTVSGAVAGGTIDIGGSDGDSFHVDSTGNMWLGNGSYSSAPFRVSAFGDLDIGGTDSSSLHIDSIGRLWSGHNDFASAPFYINNNGDMYASNATFANTITANSSISLATTGNIYANGTTAKFGHNVDGGTSDGLFITSDNYWYTNGIMRIGGANGINLSAGNITLGSGVSISGTTGNAATASRWLNARTINLGGDLSGSVSIDGSSDVTLTATVVSDGVVLGTDTTGNYIATIAGIANQVNVSGSGSESAAVTLSLPQSIHTGATPIFGSVTLNQSGGGAKVNLTGATSNWIEYGITGVAAPAFTTRSAGTKVVLYPNMSVSSTDYAIGIEGSHMWQSVPQNTSGQGFKWYGGTTLAATLTGTGNLTVTNNVITASTGYVQTRYLTTVANTGPYIDMNGSTVRIENRTTVGNTVFTVRGMASQSGVLQAWQDSAGTALASISSTGAITARNPSFASSTGNLMVLRADGGIDHGYLTFYIDTDNPSTRSGYFGYGSSGTTTLTLANEMTNGPINLVTNGSGGLTFNGNTVWHAGNDGSGSGLDADLLDGQSGAYYLPAGSYTAADVLTKLLTVDGSGSGLDADLLDGFSGAHYLDWTNVTNKPDPVITLGGVLSGSVTLTDLASGTLTASYVADSVTLGTHTAGNYVASVSSGTGISVSGTGEGAAVTVTNTGVTSLAGTTNQITASAATGSLTLSLPQNIHTGATTTFLSTILTNGEVSGGITKSQIEMDYPGGLYGHNIKTRHNAGAQLNNAIDLYVWRHGVDGAATPGTARVASFDFAQSNIYSPTVISSNLTVTGNLQVDGTTVTVSSASMTVSDPIITLGGAATPAIDDNKDRGVQFRYNNSGGKTGYFGYDDSTGYFTFIPEATNTGGVFSGTKGVIDATLLTSSLSGTLQATQFPGISGDITINAGTLTAAITADSIVNNDINSAAGIVDTKLATISTANKVSLTALDIDGGTDIGAALADTDLFIVDDGGAGTNRKAAATRITDYTFGKVSGDITIASNGVATIAANSIALGADTTGNYIATISAGTGISVSGSGVETAATTITNTGVTSLTGTANRVTVSAATGAITLNGPQDIHTTAIPTFGQVLLGEGTSPTHAATLTRFGSTSTSGILDWNDVTNTRPGTGPTLLLGTETNGPGGGYYHPFNIEYGGTKNGTGNVTQFAIPYGNNVDNFWIRGRYSGSWTSWSKIWTAGNDGPSSGLDADLLDGQHGSYYLPAASYTAADVLSKLLTVDGPGSGLDADTLDGVSGAGYLSTGYLYGRALPDANTADTTAGVLVSYLNGTNKPTGTDHAALTLSYDSAWSVQMAGDWRTNNWYVRTQNNTAWGSWATLWHSANDGSGSGLDADLLDAQEGSYYRDATNINAGTLADARLSSTVYIDRGSLSASADWNTITTQGTYRQGAASWTGTNQPTGAYSFGTLSVLTSNTSVTQNYYPHNTTTGPWTRTKWNASDWQAWQRIWTNTSDGAGSTLDADLLDNQEGTYYLDWTNFTNKPDPVVTVNLTGDVTGTGNATLTDLGNGTINVATTVTTGVEVSDTAPVSPSIGTQWFDSSSGRLFIYYDNSWVEIGSSMHVATSSLGAQAVFISEDQPNTVETNYMWIQTFDDGDFTIWIEDGT